MKFYTRQKSIMQRWSDSIDAGAELVMPTALTTYYQIITDWSDPRLPISKSGDQVTGNYLGFVQGALSPSQTQP